MGQDRPVDTTPLDRALSRVGDRWTLLIVEALLARPRRFGELADTLPGIAPNILSARLRRLADERLVVATPYSQRPLRHEYALSADGRELAAALAVLAAWATQVDATTDEARRHVACGTALELRPYCPTCHRVVDDPDADHLHHL